MIILGINLYHGDSSACILSDGDMVAAAEEERFRRIKHWAGFPSESIKYCLEEMNITINDVDHFAINTDPTANLFKKISYTIGKRPDLKLVFEKIKNKKEKVNIEDELAKVFDSQDLKGKIHHVEHHFSHLASAHFVSPFKNSVTVSIDGFGDFSSAAWGVGNNTNITVEGRVYFPHSLGIFYQALTQYLGFPNYGDEYKVMGLAPYGTPRYVDELEEVVNLHNDGAYSLNLEYFRHHKEKIDYEWKNCAPHVGCLFSGKLLDLLGPARDKSEPIVQRHKDLASSVQRMYEVAFFKLLNILHNKHNIDELTLAGGCAMNSVANGKIRRSTPFKKVYIQSAAGDAGGAIGAAFAVAQKLGDCRKKFVMNHAYWGPWFSNDKIERLLKTRDSELANENCEVQFIENEEKLCIKTAEVIADGKVVGWFQGRME